MILLRFPPELSFGFKAKPNWRTEIVESGSGYTFANRRRSRPLHTYTAGHNARKQSFFGKVRAFHYIANGGAEVFLFKDWHDFECPDFAGSGVIVGGQLYKRYAIDAYHFDRKITRPISPIVGIGGSLGVVDYATGSVTGGSATAWSGKFDVPCRFAEDGMEVEMIDGPDGARIVGWPDIEIEEVLE